MINQLLLSVSLLVFGFSHPNIPNIPIFVVETEGSEEVVTTIDGESMTAIVGIMQIILKVP